MRARALPGRAAAVVGLVAAGLVPTVPAGAAAEPRWHDGACAPDDEEGVTVVVDFQELGGGVNVRCTERSPTDGADALDAAGIAWQGVLRWGRGFVCKIAGKPADDPCIDTPPAAAYWSYWLAPRGGTWCYSNKGVLNRTPPPGSVEGWSFSLDKDGGQSPPPRTAPPALAPGRTMQPLPPGHCDPRGGSVPTTPPTTAPPVTRPPGGGGTAVPRPGDPPDPGGAGGPGDPGDPAPPAGTPTTTTAPGDPGSSTTTTTTTSPTTSTEPGPTDEDGRVVARAVDRDDEATAAGAPNPTDLSVDATAADGAPVSTVAGIGVVAALAVAGAVLARRRRGRDDGSPDDPRPG